MRTLASLATGVPDDGAAGADSQDRRLPALIQALVQSPPAGVVALLRGSNVVLSLATFAAGLYALSVPDRSVFQPPRSGLTPPSPAASPGSQDADVRDVRPQDPPDRR